MQEIDVCVLRRALPALGLFLLVAMPGVGAMHAAAAATIVIEVQAQGGDASFDFGGDLGDFGISSEAGQGRQVFEELEPGKYAVTGQAPSGWTMLAIMCHHPAASIDFATSTARFELSADDSVPCTFIFRAR